MCAASWDDSADLDDREYPDPDPWEDDSTETIDCPSCGAEVYEDAERCPVCGDYLLRDTTSVWSDKPAWWLLLGILGIIAVATALTIGF